MSLNDSLIAATLGLYALAGPAHAQSVSDISVDKGNVVISNPSKKAEDALRAACFSKPKSVPLNQAVQLAPISSNGISYMVFGDYLEKNSNSFYARPTDPDKPQISYSAQAYYEPDRRFRCTFPIYVDVLGAKEATLVTPQPDLAKSMPWLFKK